MKQSLRLAIAQINCTVGDLEGNVAKICEYLKAASIKGADIVLFPELAITGYPPEDLLLKNNFIDDNLAAIRKVAKFTNDIVAVVGFVDKKGGDIYNAAAVIYKGEIKGIYHKMMLPNYGVFDEERYFKNGDNAVVFGFGNIILGVNICEDMWHKDGPLNKQVLSGANLILNINASPYHIRKIREREDLVRKQAGKNGIFISYANLAGGQDELVFDGQSMVVDANGKVAKRAAAFKEDLVISDIEIPVKKTIVKNIITISKIIPEKKRPALEKKEVVPFDTNQEVYEALSLGLKDYVDKNGFKQVVIGLSGGIDSALVAALAADSLGKDNVTGVFMPTHYTSSQSETDARTLASNLGIKFMTVPVDQIFRFYLASLESTFSGHPKDITEENLQARIRGNVLMAISNKFGWLVLTTGNKSEMSTGYATLYGDMAGGLAVIKDVYKTMVYKLARYRNSVSKAIPDSILTKEPTAELKPNQKDSDTLPPYETLDKILKAYIEEDKGPDEIAVLGFDKDIISKVLAMVDKSEYKRRQSPPGIRITPKAFGKDRRMPITNKYK